MQTDEERCEEYPPDEQPEEEFKVRSMSEMRLNHMAAVLRPLYVKWLGPAE